MNRRWICSDVWMDILPSFDRPKLGLKMALLSYRFDALVDKHFDGTKELTLWNPIIIRKGKGQKANDIGPKAKLSAWVDDSEIYVEFPLPDRPLPNKIRFKDLRIEYIDYSVIEFLRSNKKIWDRSGTELELCVYSEKTENDQPIWDVLASEIWPVFAMNIHHLSISGRHPLDNLGRRISPTILTDLDHLNSIDTDDLFPNGIADDGPNSFSGQPLSKWLHTPRKDGKPKRLLCGDLEEKANIDWVNSFKEAFARATNSSVIYKIQFAVWKTPIEPFESANERTEEKLTLEKVPRTDACWLLKRCPISEKAAAIQWENDDNLNKVRFELCWGDINDGSIGPLSPPAEEEKKEADQSNKK